MTPNVISPPRAARPAHVALVGGHDDEPRHPNRKHDPVQVVIAHEQRLARAGLRLLIEGEDGLAVAGEADTGEYAVALARRRRPDLVVISLELRGLDAVEATRQIVRDPALAHVRVLALTPADSQDSIVRPLRAGARGLVAGDSDPAELVRALRLMAAGETPISPGLMGAVLADVASRPEPPRPAVQALDELTAREREVVGLVAFGLNNQEIAQQLVISPATSRTHVSRAMRKLDARDRAQLVAFAYQLGFALPGGTPSGAPGAVAAGPPDGARAEPPSRSAVGRLMALAGARHGAAPPPVDRAASLMPVGA